MSNRTDAATWLAQTIVAREFAEPAARQRWLVMLLEQIDSDGVVVAAEELGWTFCCAGTGERSGMPCRICRSPVHDTERGRA